MLKIAKILVFIFSGFLLAGCALTTEPMSLNYKIPTNLGKVDRSKARGKIMVGKIEDTRGENPRLIIHKKNGYNDTAMGGYVAEKDLAVIIRDAISNSLKEQGYPVSSKGPRFILNGNLISYDSESVMGLFSSELKGKLELNLQLLDKISNRVVWQDLIVGQGMITDKMLMGDYTALRKAFKKALDNAILQLVNERGFKQAILK